ncbi:major histocompatibility complex class I-related gene protein-like [Acanthopagrus schlegelii]
MEESMTDRASEQNRASGRVSGYVCHWEKVLRKKTAGSLFRGSVLHSMKHFITASTGIPNIPEVVTTAEVDELLIGCCDSNNRLDLKHDIAKSFIIKYPEQLEWYRHRCVRLLPNFKASINILMSLFNQTGGVHVLQMVEGCEWDDETEEVKCFIQIGYDGEDLLELDGDTSTWIALRPEAFPAKILLEANKELGIQIKILLTQIVPELLKQFVEYGRSVLLRTVCSSDVPTNILSSPELPSVSLLQKTPSSPVSCLATGFYPHRASLVWRKDGEELHEEVDHGEILPNHDGTFQMSVDLNLSSVTPEDWTRYDCVFQLSGVNEDIITRLEKDRIRTNWGKSEIRGC